MALNLRILLPVASSASVARMYCRSSWNAAAASLVASSIGPIKFGDRGISGNP